MVGASCGIVEAVAERDGKHSVAAVQQVIRVCHVPRGWKDRRGRAVHSASLLLEAPWRPALGSSTTLPRARVEVRKGPKKTAEDSSGTGIALAPFGSSRYTTECQRHS